ncbi:MAG TPA: DUF1697 domain-containing protein [Terracidiphilus sp.]|nr:DUF1697 domain-containing protein [Terracidiphilus sp.]
MPTYVALLRAVNVGGTGKLPMADLRALLAGLGFQNVETYIQSGNAVFDAPGSAAGVHKALAAALEKRMGKPVGVLLRTHQQLTQAIAGNPYPAEAVAGGARVHAVFLSAPAPASAAAELNRVVAAYPKRRDRFTFRGDVLYLHLPDGAADTKFTPAVMSRAVGNAIESTARNWNTVLKLHEMSAR